MQCSLAAVQPFSDLKQDIVSALDLEVCARILGIYYLVAVLHEGHRESL